MPDSRSEPGASARLFVVAADKLKAEGLARRLEACGFRCEAAPASPHGLHGVASSGFDLVVALEVPGSWQPTRRLIEAHAGKPLPGSPAELRQGGAPLIVIAEAGCAPGRADAVAAASGAAWDWIDASTPDREIAARLNRVAATRRMALELEEMSHRCAAMETVDRLTGLPGHRAFQECLAREFRRAERYGTPLSLVLMDPDRFRSFNETHGHALGDRALQEIGSRLRAMVRGVDMAARYGGEEFALLLPETDSTAALKVAERARVSLEGVAPALQSDGAIDPAAADASPRITASLGVASYPDQGVATQGLLLAGAEAALRRAKAEGRNRVVAHVQAGARPAAAAGGSGGSGAAGDEPSGWSR
ncbi:MAG TPA: GGDEF domain-containing protein [Candidatus Polarisedimenticolia bacterium]|nr:GGDEF domain-containing protein [Candidatus Polarisedimenticolia bacterium]